MQDPNVGLSFFVKNEKSQEYDLEEVVNKADVSTNNKFYHRFVYPNLIWVIFLHTCALTGLYYLFKAKLLTLLWLFTLGFLSAEAITLGAHRYYSHKSYKATPLLRTAMIFFQTIAGQNSMFTWARDHRLHHKYSDSDADPHNAARGFVFSHIGWLVTRKHPLVIQKGKCIEVSDLLEDKILMFQHNYFVPVYLIVGFLCPTFIPVLVWNEDWWTSFLVAYCLRYTVVLHLTWCVNSLAHMVGTKPYDGRIHSTDSELVANLTGGDGWHNYHHSFPWDARAGEFSVRGGFNTKCLLKLAKYGLAYDLKTASDTVIEGHTNRHGDGTRPTLVEHPEKKQEDGNIKNGGINAPKLNRVKAN